jgi:hypothetical protein
MDDKTTQGGAFDRRDGSISCILPSWETLRDRRGLEMGLVQNRRCSGDGMSGRRAGNRVSSTNSTRMALVGSKWHTFSEVFSAISLGPERGFFGMGRDEITRAQTAHVPSLVSIDFVCHQPTSGPGSRVSKRQFDRENRATKARTCAGEGSNRLFCDVRSICQRLFIPTTSPRRREVGRRPGEAVPPQRAPINEELPIAPTSAVTVNFASAHAVRTPSALSPYLLQWCVF